jgi:hypothetical protein
LAVAAFGIGASAAAEAGLVNPGIPAREDYTYSRVSGGKTETVSISLVYREEGGKAWYDYQSRDPDTESLARLDAPDLFATYSESTSRSAGAAIRRTTTILESSAAPAPDALLLAGFETMPQALRGYPFGARRKARLEFVGSGSGGGFALEFSVLGRETISSGGRSWDCWKTQIGLGGLLAAFGKTHIWYSVASPNVMVRSEGASGPPGSPQVVMELQRYAASGKGWSPGARK